MPTRRTDHAGAASSAITQEPKGMRRDFADYVRTITKNGQPIKGQPFP